MGEMRKGEEKGKGSEIKREKGWMSGIVLGKNKKGKNRQNTVTENVTERKRMGKAQRGQVNYQIMLRTHSVKWPI